MKCKGIALNAHWANLVIQVHNIAHNAPLVAAHLSIKPTMQPHALRATLACTKTLLVIKLVSIARQECIKTFKPNHFVCPAFLDFIKISKHNVCVKNAILDNIQTTRNLPNATNVTLDDTAKADKPRAFPASLAKRELLLNNGATNAPKATSPMKKNKFNASPVKRMNTNRKWE